jgi:hypothetical protein
MAAPDKASACCQTAEPKNTPLANAKVAATGSEPVSPTKLGVIAKK